MPNNKHKTTNNKHKSSINEEAIKSFLKRKQKILSLSQYIEGILSGNRVILGQAITLIESTLPRHFDLAQAIIEKCIPHSGNSLRVGITGVPGAGKSTFIEALGTHLAGNGNKVAVLTIDPSSEVSGGSILGDKTRMEKLSTNDNAFVRPSPSAGYGGGVARKTMEAIILCEAAGYDKVFVETVGVGQSETAVHSMVDFFLLIMITGAGDELQGIKKGIIERSDGMVINKADGDNIAKAENAKNQYQKALHLLPVSPTGWIPKVTTCSAIENTGIKEAWNMILQHHDLMKSSGHFIEKRNNQKINQLHQTLEQKVLNHFYQNKDVKNKLKDIETSVLENRISPYQAAQKLLDIHLNK